MDRLKNKIAIVTGGASGIGKAIAELFEKEGAAVVVFDLSGSPDFPPVDVSSEAQVADAVEEVIRRLGRIDILVNNAGMTGENAPTHRLSEEGFDKAFAVDVKGVFLCTKHVIPHMMANGGGSIVNLSSVYATHGTRGDLSAYHAAKGAVLAMTKQDAITYGKRNIRVNAILPGGIETPLFRAFGDVFPGGWEALEVYASKRHPMGRLGQPEDVAYGALYLASDEAKFVTGTGLYIDGGYSAW